MFLVISLVLLMQSSTRIPVPVPEPPRDFHYKYEVINGFFKQSEPDTDDTTFDFVSR